jgi:hypothetical protein
MDSRSAVVALAVAFANMVQRAVERLDEGSFDELVGELRRAHGWAGGEMVRRTAAPRSTT